MTQRALSLGEVPTGEPFVRFHLPSAHAAARDSHRMTTTMWVWSEGPRNNNVTVSTMTCGRSTITLGHTSRGELVLNAHGHRLEWPHALKSGEWTHVVLACDEESDDSLRLFLQVTPVSAVCAPRPPVSCTVAVPPAARADGHAHKLVLHQCAMSVCHVRVFAQLVGALVPQGPRMECHVLAGAQAMWRMLHVHDAMEGLEFQPLVVRHGDDVALGEPTPLVGDDVLLLAACTRSRHHSSYKDDRDHDVGARHGELLLRGGTRPSYHEHDGLTLVSAHSAEMHTLARVTSQPVQAIPLSWGSGGLRTLWSRLRTTGQKDTKTIVWDIVRDEVAKSALPRQTVRGVGLGLGRLTDAGRETLRTVREASEHIVHDRETERENLREVLRIERRRRAEQRNGNAMSGPEYRALVFVCWVADLERHALDALDTTSAPRIDGTCMHDDDAQLQDVLARFADDQQLVRKDMQRARRLATRRPGHTRQQPNGRGETALAMWKWARRGHYSQRWWLLSALQWRVAYTNKLCKESKGALVWYKRAMCTSLERACFARESARHDAVHCFASARNCVTKASIQQSGRAKHMSDVLSLAETTADQLRLQAQHYPLGMARIRAGNFHNDDDGAHTAPVHAREVTEDISRTLAKAIEHMRAENSVQKVNVSRFVATGTTYVGVFLFMTMLVQCALVSECGAHNAPVSLASPTDNKAAIAVNLLDSSLACQADCHSLCTCEPSALLCDRGSGECMCEYVSCSSCHLCGKMRAVFDQWLLVVYFVHAELEVVILLVAVLSVTLSLPSFTGVKAQDEENEHKRMDNLKKTGLLIAHYGDAQQLRKTLTCALCIFPPENIIVCHNANSDVPYDGRHGVQGETLALLHELEDRYNRNAARTGRPLGGAFHYVWVAEGSKSVALTMGATSRLLCRDENGNMRVCEVRERFEFLIVMDNDVLLPAEFSPNMDLFRDEDVAALMFPICAQDTTDTHMGRLLLNRLQDVEYKKSAVIKALQSAMGSVFYPHGALSMWRTEVFLDVMFHHSTIFDGEDLEMGVILRTLYPKKRILMDGATFVPTSVPAHWMCLPYNSNEAHACGGNVLARLFRAPFRCTSWGCGYDEKSLLLQRITSWDASAHRNAPVLLKLLVTGWNPVNVALKPFYLYEILTIVQDWLRVPLFFFLVVKADKAYFFGAFGMLFLVQALLLSIMNARTFKHRRDLSISPFVIAVYPFYNFFLLWVRVGGMLYNVLVCLPQVWPIKERFMTLPHVIHGDCIRTDGCHAPADAPVYPPMPHPQRVALHTGPLHGCTLTADGWLLCRLRRGRNGAAVQWESLHAVEAEHLPADAVAWVHKRRTGATEEAEEGALGDTGAGVADAAGVGLETVADATGATVEAEDVAEQGSVTNLHWDTERGDWVPLDASLVCAQAAHPPLSAPVVMESRDLWFHALLLSVIGTVGLLLVMWRHGLHLGVMFVGGVVLFSVLGVLGSAVLIWWRKGRVYHQGTKQQRMRERLE